MRSLRIWNEVVIGPRDNGFPGTAVALDGPVCTAHCAFTFYNYYKSTHNEIWTAKEQKFHRTVIPEELLLSVRKSTTSK